MPKYSLFQFHGSKNVSHKILSNTKGFSTILARKMQAHFTKSVVTGMLTTNFESRIHFSIVAYKFIVRRPVAPSTKL